MVISRTTLVLLCVGCGGTVADADAGSDASPDVVESGSTCTPRPACAHADVIAGPVALSTLVGKQEVLSVVTTECGFAFLLGQQAGVSVLPISWDASGFALGTPYPVAVANGVPEPGTLAMHSLYDTLFVRADGTTHSFHFSGPALGAASIDVVVPPDVPMDSVFYAAHDDRLLFLFEESPGNETVTLLWMEAARDGSITHALEPAPGGYIAVGYNAFSPGLVGYANGFAWFVPSDAKGDGNVFFSSSTGNVIEVAAPGAVDFLPLTPWPYGAGVAFNGFPSGVVLDNGQAGIALTRHASYYYLSDSSAELGIIDASRYAFSQVDVNGNASNVKYDGGPLVNSETFQPPPLLAVRGGEALLVNLEGNVFAIGCAP